MKFEKVNIGLLIEQKMNELDINKSEMARRSGIANQNINRVLDKSSIDTDKLVAISEALGFNFFDCFHPIEANETEAKTMGTSVSVSDNAKAAALIGNKFETNGNFSPASMHGDINMGNADAVQAEHIKSLEALLREKDIRIKEKDDRIAEKDALLAEKERVIRVYERVLGK